MSKLKLEWISKLKKEILWNDFFPEFVCTSAKALRSELLTELSSRFSSQNKFFVIFEVQV